MKQLIYVFLTLVFFNSCKALVKPVVILENENIKKQETGKDFINGKITTNKKKLFLMLLFD